MVKILFVCHGNICRSPMAEFVMKKLVKASGLDDGFEIASCATSTEEIGNPVYPPARAKMREHGIDPSGKTARQITARDFEHYDFVVAMDNNNLRNIRRMFGGKYDDKLSLLMDYTGEKKQVADPWYTGDFDETWRDVNTGCKALLEYCTAR